MLSPEPLPLAWPPPDVALAASLLAADPLALLAEAKALHKAGVDWLHVDIMDAHFVPNLALSVHATTQLVARQPLPIDVHLMVSDPMALIDELGAAGVSIITVHAEAARHLQRVLAHIRSLGVRVGLALSPATPLNAIEEVLGDIDLVLVMGVNPGFGGQTFLPHTLNKLQRLTQLLARHAPEVVIQVDGGVHNDNIRAICRCGARAIVAGTALVGARSRPDAVEQLRARAKAGLKA